MSHLAILYTADVTSLAITDDLLYCDWLGRVRLITWESAILRLWLCEWWVATPFELFDWHLDIKVSRYLSILCLMPSVLWCCWLVDRKGIRPVKNWVVGCWHGHLSGARCRLAYGPADATACHSVSLASVKSRLDLPFWYRLTRVVLEKWPLSGCVCVCVCHSTSG